MANQEADKILDEIAEIEQKEQETIKRILDTHSEKMDGLLEDKGSGGDKPKKPKGKEFTRISGIKRSRNGDFHALYSDGLVTKKIYKKSKEELKEKLTEK